MVPLRGVLEVEQDEVLLEPDETYRAAGIYSFGGGVFERQPIHGADTAYTSLFRIHENQFILSRLNGWEGAVDVVSADLDGCLVSNEFPTFAIDSDLAYPGYLRWITRWPRFWDQLVPRGSMVRRKRVKPGQLLNLEVPLPAMAEQCRIARRLDRIQASVYDVTQRSIQVANLIGALAASIPSRPYLALGHRAGTWRRVALRDALQIHCHEVKVDARYDYAIAGVYSFGRGLFARAELNGSQTSYKVLHQLRAGQLVMSRLKAWEGALALVSPQFDGWFLSPEFPTFDIDTEQLNPMFLSTLLTSEYFWARLKDSSKGIGARKERVSAAGLLEQVIEVPTIDEQRKIAQDLESIATIEGNAAARSARVSALLPSIVNREFTCVR
jgi:type I restriction enzyme S subunit